tara:strand:+ start:415 stop:540 length:126 start_codon:yes stop_codon:yes gene_type:complete
MKKANLTWSKSALDEYLANPRKKVPGTKMSLAVKKNANEQP